MSYESLKECGLKIQNKTRSEALKLIYQWVKTNHINVREFHYLIDTL